MIDLESCIRFLRKLIQTESLPGHEKAVAKLVKTQMDQLGFDKSEMDQAGNVIGLVRGVGTAPALNFNTHLDHVDIGDPSEWPYPPFQAKLSDGKVWGRGAVDIKGPLASQVFAIGSLAKCGHRPPGDVYVTSVVQEEVGGVGAQFLSSHLHTPLVIIGEPSSNQLKIGHRGRIEVQIRFRGKSSHASMPQLAANPLYALARFLSEINNLEMQEDPILGKSTVEPTLITTDQSSTNVIPGEARLFCDWRTISNQTADQIVDQLSRITEKFSTNGITSTVEVPRYQQKTYTGLTYRCRAEHPSFSISSEEPVIRSALSILNDSIGSRSTPDVWQFATDGGYFHRAGQKVIGFGPGEDYLAHTIKESIDIASIEESLHGYRELALNLAQQTLV